MTITAVNYRATAEYLRAKADRIDGSICKDFAYWSQPSHNTSAGRRLSARKERDRTRMDKAMRLRQTADEYERRANELEANGPRVAGAAAAKREQAIAECVVRVGDSVSSIYGVRKVIKVNAKTVLIEGAFGPVKIEKHLIRVIPQPPAA